MHFLLLLLFSLVSRTWSTWQPYCPWNEPGINKKLYSCSNVNAATSGTIFSNKTRIRVGLLLPQTPAQCSRIGLFTQGLAAEIAVEDINARSDLLPQYHLELVTASDYISCERAFDTLGYAYQLRVEEQADVLIGPACGDLNSGKSVASLAAAENIPVISVASFQDELNDVEKYPTFTRLYESTEIQAYYHAAVHKYFGWREIVTVVQRETSNSCTTKWADLTSTLDDIGYKKIKSYNMNKNDTLATMTMDSILRENRIVSIFGSPKTVRSTVLSFYRTCKKTVGCKWSDYRFIAVNFMIGFVISNEQILPWRCDQSNRVWREMCSCCDEAGRVDDGEAKEAFKSVIYIVTNVPKFSEQDDLFCRIMKKIDASPIKKKPRCIEEVYLIQHVYDTVLVYSNALNKTNDPSNGRQISQVFKQLGNINGKSGKIITNPQGSRYTEMLAYFLLEESHQNMTAVLRLEPNKTTGRYRVVLVDGQREPSHVSDTPPCDWSDLSCEKPLSTLISGVVALVLGVVGGTAIRIYFERKGSVKQSFFLTPEQLEGLAQANIEANVSRRVDVQRTDMIVSATDKATLNTLRELGQIHHSNIVQLLHCCLDISGMTICLENCQKGPLQYLIRTEQRLQTPSFIRSFAMDILRGLDFLNGSVFSYHGCLTSLNCVVDGNWNVKLKGFYLRQVNQGEVYSNSLSETPGVELREFNSPRQIYDGLWMSPEYLNEKRLDVSGHRKNDIYSFGVILSELIESKPPFGIFFDEYIDVKVLQDQIELIKNGEKPFKGDVMLQQLDLGSASSNQSSVVENDGADSTSSSSESVSESEINTSASSSLKSRSYSTSISYNSSDFEDFEDFDEDLTFAKQCCLLCVQSDPEDRPGIQEVWEKLDSGSQQLSGSLVDQWLLTLERKSKELKDKFNLKNKDFVKEKEKTEELVYSLLPREIAEQKKMSDAPIDPKVYSNCSFFYSDIKGFTSIVADLTNLSDGGPMDVVEMLDNLYTIMDKAIGKNNVVKIETIGDAYVVVSGLPVPDINDAVHAKHIASFALDVLSTTKDITVRRLNNRPVYMRIGIHSGSCVAGLAGNYMYHYCIYGKEPRYANCLESSGEANRIQMSDEMRKILEKNFQYQFSFVERKPSIHVGGSKKKTDRTWWLTGQAGVQRDMPHNDEIYKKLEFRRKISSTANPKLLLKGVAKLKSEATRDHIRTLSESSDTSYKKKKIKSAETASQVSHSTLGKMSNKQQRK